MWFNAKDKQLNFKIQREGNQDLVTQNESELDEIELKMLTPFLAYSIYCTFCGKVFKTPKTKAKKHLKDGCSTAELKPLDSTLLQKARDARKPRQNGKRQKANLDSEDEEEGQYSSKSIDNIVVQKETTFRINQGDKSNNMPPQQLELIDANSNIPGIEKFSENHSNKIIEDDADMNKSVNLTCNDCKKVIPDDGEEHQCCTKDPPTIEDIYKFLPPM